MRAYRSKHGQRGAALVVGMLLLLVLTLLAISGMNTSSLELLMAGNVQYQQNAFQAAEAGLETGYYLGDEFAEIEDQEVEGLAATFSVEKADLASDTQIPAVGSTINAYTLNISELTSSAASVRGARAQNALGYGIKSMADASQKTALDPEDPGLE